MGQQMCGSTTSYNHTLHKQFSNQPDIHFGDQEQHGDNPAKQKLNKAFLHTQIVASWNILQQKSGNLPKLQTAFFRANLSLPGKIIGQSQNNMRFHPKDKEFIQQTAFTDNSQKLSNKKSYRESLKQQYQNLQINVSNFIKIRSQNINDFYIFKQKIGEGTFGNVYKGYQTKTGQIRAIKSLKKKSMNNTSKINFIAQIDLLKIIDHPNIIKLYDLFLYDGNYYVVTQYCDGGSLQQFYKERKNQLTEVTIRIIMKQLLSVLSYLSNQAIVHRDLKLENIVFLNKPSSSPLTDDFAQSFEIKIIDFGTAVKIKKHHKNPSGLVGTLYYIAPQFTRGFFTQKCDVWSAGIVFYILLFKQFPFNGKNENQILDEITGKTIDFDRFNKLVSAQALNLVKLMLNKNHLCRHPAQSLLKSEWLKHTAKQTISEQMSQSAANNLALYQRKNNFVSLIQSFLSFKKISQQERQKLSKMFFQIDKDNSGVIQLSQLITFYKSRFINIKQEEIIEIAQNIDKNNSGKIDFNQFITAMTKRNELFADSALKEAFQYVDNDKTGFISKKEIKQVLKQADKKQIQQLFNDLDQNGDNQISFEQFVAYLKQY